jgi:hypothetical protein
MPDPKMVSRAHRAAVTLEQAWERWRVRQGLTAEPKPPVSSYVGYSIAEPEGRPRVVIGIDAAEAETLAALLDGGASPAAAPAHGEAPRAARPGRRGPVRAPTVKPVPASAAAPGPAPVASSGPAPVGPPGPAPMARPGPAVVAGPGSAPAEPGPAMVTEPGPAVLAAPDPAAVAEPGPATALPRRPRQRAGRQPYTPRPVPEPYTAHPPAVPADGPDVPDDGRLPTGRGRHRPRTGRAPGSS